MSDDLKRALQPMVDEAVGNQLEEMVDAKLRQRLGEGAVILPLGLLADDIPELKAAQDAILRIMREKLAR